MVRAVAICIKRAISNRWIKLVVYILRTHLSGFGSSTLLLFYPVSCHTGELANLFQVSIVFLIGNGRKDTRILGTSDFEVWRYGICEKRCDVYVDTVGGNS